MRVSEEAKKDMIDIPNENLVYVPSNRKSTIERLVDEGYYISGIFDLKGISFTILKKAIK